MNKKYIAILVLASSIVGSGYAIDGVGSVNIGNTDIIVEVIQKPDTQRPNIQKPDIEKPDIQKPDIQKPDIQKPDIQKPEPPKYDRPRGDGYKSTGSSKDTSKKHNGNPLGGEDAHKNSILTNDSRVTADNTYINFGYIKGYPDKTFQPDKGLTREEYAEIVNRLLHFEPTNTDIYFTDVDQTRWSYRSIIEMANYGILVGTGDGKYEPERKITKEEAAIIIDRIIYSDYVKDTIPSQAKIEVRGSDVGKKALSRLYNMGIVNSLVEDNVIDGNEVIERWQIVTILNKLIYTDLNDVKINQFKDINDKDKYFKDIVKSSMNVID